MDAMRGDLGSVQIGVAVMITPSKCACNRYLAEAVSHMAVQVRYTGPEIQYSKYSSFSARFILFPNYRHHHLTVCGSHYSF